MSKGKLGVLITAIIVVIAVAIAGITMFRDSGTSNTAISQDEAYAQLQTKLKKISVTDIEVEPQQLSTTEFLSVQDEMPDINENYPMVVRGSGEVDAEIFSSGEKAAESGTDSFLTVMAKEFNAEKKKTASGKTMSISLRSVPSGTAADYITSGAYLPEGYTPSNTLFGALLEQGGVSAEIVSERTVGNVAGILVENDSYKTLQEKYGEIDIADVVEAVVAGELTMAYSNPYTSASGLNFLMTLLNTISPNDLFSDEAVAQFQSFQANVPLVSYTTQQLTTSAEKGLVQAYLSEYQTYQNDPSLSRKYEFVPFGVRHDNPLYTVGTITEDEKETLEEFAAYCEEHQDVAEKDGFNGMDSYKNSDTYAASDVAQAQTIWKEEKNANSTIVATFIVDQSGSMAGEPLQQLQTAMLNVIQYINEDSQIGLIGFDSDVYRYLPIASFDLTQKTMFKGAVNTIHAGGSTAMYDAIMVGANDVYAKCQEIGGNTTPMIFVLTDGDSNSGLSFSNSSGIIEGMQIPVYTISYNYANSQLDDLANINEAASITGNSENIIYKLKSLFNVTM